MAPWVGGLGVTIASALAIRLYGSQDDPGRGIVSKVVYRAVYESGHRHRRLSALLKYAAARTCTRAETSAPSAEVSASPPLA